MTNRTDLNECSAQIKIIKQLITQPETFELDKILIELETKKKLLIKFMPRDYATIVKGLESGIFKHPGDWVKPPKIREEKKEESRPEKIEEPEPERIKREAEEKAVLEMELQATKDKLAKLEALKELEKEEETEIKEEAAKEAEGE